MRILHRRANIAEQFQPVADRARSRLAELIDGRALHVLHRQVRHALGSRSAVDQSRDVRMIQARQHLPFHAKSPQDFRRIHAAPYEFNRNFLAASLLAVSRETRQPHRTHPSASDAFFQLIRPRAKPGRIFARFLARIMQRVPEVRGRLGQKTARVVVTGQQAFHLTAHGVVARAGHPQIRGAILRRTLQRALKDLPDLRPSLRSQCFLPSSRDAEMPAPSSSSA